MEQEYEQLTTSPQNVRRQLLFMTPFKKRSAFPTKPTEMENSPKGKVSKSKLPLGGAPNKKVVIDFGVENNYFLNQSTPLNMFNVEEENGCFEDFRTEVFGSAHTPGDFYFNSPFQTIRKSKNNSGSINDYISVAKESQHSNSFGESPFCKLLNESDKLSVKSYQTLSGINELDEEQEILREKHAEQLKVLDRFLELFGERNMSIMNLFDKDAIFEIIGEEKVYPLDTTLNALANSFLGFEYETEQLEYDYRFGFSGDNNEIIVTTSGRLTGENLKSGFVISAKVLVHENLINHVKLQLS